MRLCDQCVDTAESDQALCPWCDDVVLEDADGVSTVADSGEESSYDGDDMSETHMSETERHYLEPLSDVDLGEAGSLANTCDLSPAGPLQAPLSWGAERDEHAAQLELEVKKTECAGGQK